MPMAILQRRSFWFASGCLLIVGGVMAHLPMLAHAHSMNNQLVGMTMDLAMILGMIAIVLGAIIACAAEIRSAGRAPALATVTVFEAPESTRLNRWHAGLLAVLVIGLVIDVMKPATLGFVLPGLAREYAIPRSTAALLPLSALIGTVIGSFLWGWLADRHGRRTSIIVSTILFVSTSVCGAMPSFGWNLLMCFLMGTSAGGMLPVVYTLLTEMLPSRHRSWLLVLVGGTGLVGGYLAASLTAYLFEPVFGWRVLWLQGFPTGILLLVLARFIPESPQFLAAQGRACELAEVQRKYELVALATPEIDADDGQAPARLGVLTWALAAVALAWSLVNFGLLLWLPSDLQARGFSAAVASGLLSQSATIGLPAIALAAWSYGFWSSKWTLIGAIMLTVVGLIGLSMPPDMLDWPAMTIAVIATVIVGTNVTIAVLLPYSAENSAVGVRGRATGLVAGSSKIGGVAVQGSALIGLIPTLAQSAVALALAMASTAAIVAWAGRKSRGGQLGLTKRN